MITTARSTVAERGFPRPRPSGAFVRAVVVASTLAVAAVAGAQPRSVAHSFTQLQVTVGNPVIVTSVDGKTFRGRVVSLDGDELEVERVRWFKRQRRTFTEPAVRRVSSADSLVNGVLIGTGAGALAALVAAKNCEAELCQAGLVLAPLALGPAVGGVLDWFINRTIYTAPALGATVGPAFGRARVGVTARVTFGNPQR